MREKQIYSEESTVLLADCGPAMIYLPRDIDIPSNPSLVNQQKNHSNIVILTMTKMRKMRNKNRKISLELVARSAGLRLD
jgi:hypothetical protein